MSANAIRWMSVAPNYRGAQRVTICRKNQFGDLTAQLPIYKPTAASLTRVLTLIETESQDHVISLSIGSITGRMSIMLHAGLKRLPKGGPNGNVAA